MSLVIDAQLLSRALKLSTASIHEAQGRTGAFLAALKPVGPAMRLAGPAFTVQCPAGHNLNIHRAVARARPGDILVVSCGTGFEFGYWGEILSVAAQARGLGGLVIDACVRDADSMEAIGFPVFSRGLCIRGTGKDEGGGLGRDLMIGDLMVRQGDMIVGDRDGLVLTSADRFDAVIADSETREAKESDVMARLRAGETTLDIYGFDPV